MSQLLRRMEQQAVDLSRQIHSSEDVAYDLLELMQHERGTWGKRMRTIKSMGEPTALLGGLSGPPVPNAEPVTVPAAVTTTTARAALFTLTSTGSQSWNWVPAGNTRSPQSWIVWASGTATTTTSSTVGWTTAVGQTQINQTSADTNNVLAANGALTPGFNGTVNWNYRGHATITAPGTTGTVKGSHEVQMSNNAAGSGTNTVTGVGGVAAGTTLDTTQGFFWGLDLTNSTTANSVQLIQFVILSLD